MNAALARRLLFLSTTIRGQPLSSALDMLERSQWWSEEELAAYTEERLERLLEHCLMNVPYYRNWSLEKGKRGNESCANFLRSLPVVDKKTLRERMPEFLSERKTGRVEQAKTSGSTGLALHFPKSLEASAFQLAAMYRGHGWHGVPLGAKEARLWGIPVNRITRWKTRIKDQFLNRFREKEYSLNRDVLLNFCEKLKNEKPKYLMGYTSMVAQFAKFLEEEAIDGSKYGLDMVKCTSETITDNDRMLIRRVFKCPLVSEYGAAETGLIAFECEAGSNHVMADCCFVELLEPEEEIGINGLKEIVVTNFYNYAMPIVRYKIGDFGILSREKCRCGRVFPVLENIIGRVSNIIRTKDGRRWHSIILYYIMKGLEERGGGVIQFRVRQTELDRLEFDLVPACTFGPHVLDYLKNQCEETFGPSMNVCFRTVSEIDRESSGKLRDFVSLLSN